jgi:hypothetical protein
MNKNILILGGGLAGCLAAKFFLDKGAKVTIIDRQALGKSFVVARNHVSFHAHEKMWCATRPVKVVKKIHGIDDLEKARAMYRAKVYGEHSVEKVSINCDTKDSFLLDTNIILEGVRPATFIEGEVAAIDDNTVSYRDKSGASHTIDHDILISTLALPLVCRFTKLSPPPFHYTPIGIKFYPIPPIDYMLIEYFPGEEPYYRRTSFRAQASEEYLLNKDYPGITFDAKIFPGKVVPNPETDALVEKLDRMGIYQIGRFAQWKPKMFVNHIVPELKRRIRLT